PSPAPVAPLLSPPTRNAPAPFFAAVCARRRRSIPVSPRSLQNCFTDNPLRPCSAIRSRHCSSLLVASGPLLADGLRHDTNMQPIPELLQEGFIGRLRISDASCNAPRYSPPSRQIILRLVSQLHSRLLSWDRIAACIGASEYPTGRLEPFPVALIVSERSSPSRVRCAAPQPGARP